MKAGRCTAAALLLLGFFAAVADARASAKAAVTPVQKVVELLGGMLEKGKQEKHDEQVQFAAYKQFCDDTSGEKKRAIEEAGKKLEVLTADINKYAADAERLGLEITGHEEDIGTWSAEKKAATEVRDQEKADYDTTHKDYSESVDALQRAIEVLEKQSGDKPQASLAQLAALKGAALVPDGLKRAVDAFLQQRGSAAEQAEQQELEGLGLAEPAAAGYEFQSQGVIEMFNKLLDKFIAERTTLENEEMSKKHSYDLLVHDLDAQIAEATRDSSSKAEGRSKALGSKATAEGAFADTATTKDADEKYLGDLVATCEQKAADFETRQQLRSEELEAVNKAIEIISGSAVSGSAEKHLPSMAQYGSYAALVHLRSQTGTGASQRRAATFLRSQAQLLNSRVLASVASRVSDDPFTKVKKLIKDLIVRLMEEANDEADHKGWCDQELATNEQTRKEKTEAVETLHAEIDQLSASTAKLAEDITELSAAVAELDKAVTEATTIRTEEKSKNEATIKDAQEAQTAVAQALTVLREFYAKAGEATAFVQQQQGQEPPPIFDAPYTGQSSGGVIGMLEVIQSDFARLESETKASEAGAQKEYDTFISDSAVDKAAKVKDVEHKMAKKQDETQALTSKSGDLEGAQKELDAAVSYYEKLKPSCVDAGVSYEDRVARRKEEIESLQEALRMLNGE